MRDLLRFIHGPNQRAAEVNHAIVFGVRGVAFWIAITFRLVTKFQRKWSLKEAVPYKNGFVALTYSACR
jgi:hypothetical protein